jgi:hypothetical protein
VEAPGQERLVGAPERRVAIHARATEVGAVVALAQRDVLGPVALVACFPVLPGQLERTLHRVRAAIAEVHGGDAIGRHQLHQALRELDGPRMRRAAKGVVERKLIELLDDRIANLAPPETEIGAPKAADPIDQAMTVDVPDPAALAAHDDVRGHISRRRRMAHRVEQASCVLCLEFLVRQSLHAG